MNPWNNELRRLRAELDNIVERGTIARVDDTPSTQNLQVELGSDEVLDGIEHLQPYGLSFVPPEGSEVVCVNTGSATLAMCAGNPGDRPTASAAGTGGLYNAQGWRVFLDENDIVNLGAKIAEAFIARADKTDAALARLQAAFDVHVHATAGSTGTPSAPTAVPDLIPVGELDSVAASKAKVT